MEPKDCCVHLKAMRISAKIKLAILSPTAWSCGQCGTTESIWACLTCANFGCGIHNNRHAETHAVRQDHPLAIEINTKHLYCYKCCYWVVASKDAQIKHIREGLSQTQQPIVVMSRTRNGKSIRRETTPDVGVKEDSMYELDRVDTVKDHHRKSLMRRTLLAWRLIILQNNASKMSLSKSTSTSKTNLTVPMSSEQQRQEQSLPTVSQSSATATEQPRPSSPRPPSASQRGRLRDPKPCMTGLRNLGQTCFLNSVLQTLLNSELIRVCLLSLGEQGLLDPSSSSSSISQMRAAGSLHSTPSQRRLERQTTIECHDVLEDKSLLPSLSRKRKAGNQTETIPETERAKIGLCHKLESLYRVIWSGKWAVVTPHAILSSVWQLVPSFRGFQQQDAQELLCELAEQIQEEIARLMKDLQPISLASLGVLKHAFEGELSSTVHCNNCQAQSRRVEPFFDLSLDFPPGNEQSLDGFLEYFVKDELLDNIFHCDHCSRSSPSAAVVYRSAIKRTRLTLLPGLLRVHFKRFRWQGMTREKISTHVAFPSVLSVQPYCEENAARNTYAAAGVQLTSADSDAFTYDLLGTIVHHGRGINSGHYTAYCRNPVSGQWVHYNDAKITACPLSEVMDEDVYILVYSYRPASKFVKLLQANGGFAPKRLKPDTIPEPVTVSA